MNYAYMSSLYTLPIISLVFAWQFSCTDHVELCQWACSNATPRSLNFSKAYHTKWVIYISSLFDIIFSFAYLYMRLKVMAEESDECASCSSSECETFSSDEDGFTSQLSLSSSTEGPALIKPKTLQELRDRTIPFLQDDETLTAMSLPPSVRRSLHFDIDGIEICDRINSVKSIITGGSITVYSEPKRFVLHDNG